MTANPTATPETLEQVLTDELLARIASILSECGVDTEGEYLDDDLLEARLELMAALTPYLEAREQAFKTVCQVLGIPPDSPVKRVVEAIDHCRQIGYETEQAIRADERRKVLQRLEGVQADEPWRADDQD